jgi:DNA-binding NtrC family response regulator
MAQLLIVEDDATLRELLEDLLTYAGYGVTVVASTEAAIRALHTRPHDLILTDGLEFRPPYGVAQSQGLAALQHVAHGSPVVLFTAYEEAKALHLAERQLAGVWLKPIELDALLAAIQAVLNQAEPDDCHDARPAARHRGRE